MGNSFPMPGPPGSFHVNSADDHKAVVSKVALNQMTNKNWIHNHGLQQHVYMHFKTADCFNC